MASYARERREAVSKLRGRITVRRAALTSDGPAKGKVVGVDAGRNGTSYKFAYVPIYGAVAVLVENYVVREEPLCISGAPDIWPVEADPERRESLLHMALEYRIARQAVELWRPDFVLLDGGIILNPRLQPRLQDSGGYEGDFFSACTNALDLLAACKDRGVTLAGFIKRTKMNHYGRMLEVPNLRDAVLLNPLLERGAYTDPFQMSNKVTAAYRRLAEDLGYSPEMVEVQSCYLKTALAPFRVEVPRFCLPKVEELMSVLCAAADSEGIPYAIHEADRLARITRPTSNIHSLVLFSRALDLVRTGEITSEDLDILSLEHGQEWALEQEALGERLMEADTP
ncbi:MAG: DNA double-strand break repair nuclease NurA [Candidatus Bathyarchaeia archaeon]